MDFMQIFVLAVVQGLTEFLPISSSAHLILVPVFTDWGDQGLVFDIAVHLGTLLAVTAYFRKELLLMAVQWFSSLKTGKQTENSRLAWWVILGTVPVVIFGALVKDLVENEWRSATVIAVMMMVFAVALWWSDRKPGAKSENAMPLKDALFIGVAQALALIPGTSRSGITMTAALLLGYSREAASRFSFLLSIPVIVIAVLWQSLKLIGDPQPVDWTMLFWAVALSGLSAFLCIHYFLAFIRRIGMAPFVVYRLALGLFLLWVFWF